MQGRKTWKCSRPACTEETLCPECLNAPADSDWRTPYEWDPGAGRVEVTVLRMDRPPQYSIDALYATYKALNAECKPGALGYSDEFIVVPHSLYNLYRICTDVGSMEEARYVKRRAAELYQYFEPEFKCWHEVNKVQD